MKTSPNLKLDQIGVGSNFVEILLSSMKSYIVIIFLVYKKSWPKVKVCQVGICLNIAPTCMHSSGL